MIVNNLGRDIEIAIRQELERQAVQEIPEITPIIKLMIAFQTRFEELLKAVITSRTNKEKLPPIDMLSIIGSEKDWYQAEMTLLATPHNLPAIVVTLWTICELTEKSGEFYLQISRNTAQPSERLFYNSLAEIKKILKRRLNGILHSIYNEVWGDIGFAPFILKKD